MAELYREHVLLRFDRQCTMAIEGFFVTQFTGQTFKVTYDNPLWDLALA